MQKHKAIRIKKIRDSAKGQECTMNSPYCNHDPATVVFAHFGEPGEKGMGLKPSDSSGCYICSGCHDWVDGRVPYKLNDPDKLPLWFKAMRKTWYMLILDGVLR
jgi:hypothetical protein